MAVKWLHCDIDLPPLRPYPEAITVFRVCVVADGFQSLWNWRVTDLQPEAPVSRASDSGLFPFRD